MRSKYFHAILVGLMIVPLFGFLFIDVPSSQAQSNQVWSEPINLSNAGSSTNPQMVIDPEDIIHVIWIDDFDGYKYAKSTDGVEWTSPITVNFPFAPEEFQPVLLMDTTGVLHALWRDKSNALFYSRHSSGLEMSSGWSNKAKLADSVIDFDVIVSTKGILHIGYVSNQGTATIPVGVYYIQISTIRRSEAINLYTSQYFRAILPGDARLVNLAVSETDELETVYAVWGDLQQKKIFLSKSADQGKNWEESYELVGPDDTLGNESPHTAEINTVGNGVLLNWQGGTSGIRCTYSSRWSSDGGQEWAESIVLIDELGTCPENISFEPANDGYSLSLLKIQDNLALFAWDGKKWSDLQIQRELSALVNPKNLEPILLGCHQPVLRKKMIFLVGCDVGSSKDIWFTSRAVGSLEDWFPPPSAWSSPIDITRVSQLITSVSSVTDEDNHIHLVWVQSSFSGKDSIDPVIYYSTWNGEDWSKPAPIITNLPTTPVGLTINKDNQGRLLLTWVDETNDGLLFTWAKADRAKLPLEWSSLSILPTPSKLISSPYLLSDSLGNLVVSYAVPFNENRGIYMLRYSNLGQNWSTEYQVFNAISLGWDSANHPQMTLSTDGTLHVLFSRYSVGEAVYQDGLYYSQSSDGGSFWSEPTLVSNESVIWYRIHAIGDEELHILWQEKNGEAATSFHKLSTDGGIYWKEPKAIATGNTSLGMLDSVVDAKNHIHFLQLTSDQKLFVQEWSWDGSRWTYQGTREVLSNLGEKIPTKFSVQVTQDGHLNVITAVEITGEGNELESRLISYDRDIELTGVNPVLDLPVLPQSISQLSAENMEPLRNTPTVSPLDPELVIYPSNRNKNILGLSLVAVVIILMLIVFKPGQSRKRN